VHTKRAISLKTRAARVSKCIDLFAGLLRRFSRYQLDTGELAERIDDHVFAIVRTGERLMRALV
jgi:hypothetical protein